MYEKFAALAFALIVTVNAQDDYGYGDDAVYEQTPEPEFPADWAEYIAIPDDFGEFTNNVESVGVALWDDGEDSDIFTWAEDNFEEDNANFGAPTGDVFAAEVTFIDGVSTAWLCFNPDEMVLCAATDFTTLTVDSELTIEDDGSIDLASVETTVLSNDDDFGEAGAGIGNEIGHAYDEETGVWTIWHYADEVGYSFQEGEYEVYVVQVDEESNTFVFSDTLDLVYNGASEMASVAIASATVLYALI